MEAQATRDQVGRLAEELPGYALEVVGALEAAGCATPCSAARVTTWT